ncbi:MAG: POTRA domain-containing protein [Acidobacteriota bacterium]
MKKHALRRISIVGNMYFDTATLRERMYVQPAGPVRFRSGRYSPRMLDQDVNVIRALYQTNGFRNVDVKAEVNENPIHHGDITVTIQINEGRQWFVNSLEIEGVSAEDDPYIRPLLRSSQGQPFSASNVAADHDAILSYFFNNGYPDANFNWTQSPGPDEGFVNLRFTVQPGKRQYVRGILVRGLETTNPTLVASRILLKEGDPLSQSKNL